MANDCLVTKLKKSVNNSDLMKLGVITMQVSAIDPFNANNNIKLRYKDESGKAITDGMFMNSQGVPTGTSKDVNANTDTYLILDVNQCNVDIYNKYAVKELSCGARFYLDLKMLSYCNELTYLEANLTGTLEQLASLSSIETILTHNDSNLIGNISAIKDLSSITVLKITGITGVYGNIADLGKLTSLTRLAIGDTRISGSVEDFVAAQRLNGRTTCEGILVPYLGTNTGITFNGAAAPKASNQTLSWTASEITIA